jgi:NitT/TauT family transport system ATP-binding protein
VDFDRHSLLAHPRPVLAALGARRSCRVALRFVRFFRKLPAQNRILPLSAGVVGADACGATRPAGATEQGGKMVSPDAANEPAIVAEGVSKLFLEGTVVAFHQLSLAVKRDEIMCVVGPSGCGKTTLLRSIAGLTDVSSGKLLVHGKPVAGRPPDGVAMVFQHFGLLPWKTVYDNAAFGLAMAGASHAQIRERVAHYLELVGLTGFERHYPYQLSGGMQQRVGLVRALAMNPSILLMDEPFAALDAQTREILQEELLALMERPDERKTMVFITHSIDEAILLGDRIAVMSARPGRIKEVLDMPFGWPRVADAVRADPRFTEFRLHIWHQLHTAKPRNLRAPREVA